ncbi:MAG TPA: protein kinase [Gemmatimonadales bacterium]|nr:protein kinase [Gemmatimonadales bacterium]
MTATDSPLATALRDRYALERELGRGGMATVYLAQDLKHDRPVALKVMHPELAATLGPERFLREIHLAARLQHPHILSVIDSGEAAGRLWFTMPYVEGESLRDRIQRERQLPIEDALRITREAAQALQYAHTHGVIHRDIKPENLLLTEDGSTLVADFGVARAVQGGEEALTGTGLAVGTPAYMSPEQATSARELDARSDIYALATVLYEMLAGELPFTGPTVQAVTARRLTEAPRPLRQTRETVPESVDQAVLKALAKAPADRFVSAGEFARALAMPAVATPASAPAGWAMAGSATVTTQAGSPATPPPATPPPATRRRVPVAAVTLGLGFLIGLGVLFGWLRSRGGDGAGSAGVRRVAVLPFENLGRPEDGYFADGVTDAIRGKLAALPSLQVTASTSSGEYKGTSKPPGQIGKELGVDYLLVGKVRWQKDEAGQSRVEVSPELVQVSTASTKWQQPFDAALTDVFRVQADVAARVAQALGVALGAGERQTLTERPTANLAAYDAFLRGEEVSGRLATGDLSRLRRAVTFYRQAVALDSAFAPAWAQLSRTYSAIYANGTPAPATAIAARTAAERALALAPRRPEGHLALGDYYGNVVNDNPRSLTEYARGQRLEPRNAELLSATAVTELQLGRWDEGLEHQREAVTLDPRGLNPLRRLARTLLWLRRYPEALQAYEQALALDSTDPGRYQGKAMVYLARGDLEGARAVLRSAPREVDPAAVAIQVATFWDLYWVLDEEQQRLLLPLGPDAFDDNRAAWGMTLAETYALRGDSARARVYADSARLAYEQQIEATPGDAQLHVLHGVALAYLGRKAEAVAEGERGVALGPISRDAHGGAYNQHQLVRIYLLVGEPDKALDQLEPLLKVPYYLSPGWLRIDPTFAPLRGNPRFERLVRDRNPGDDRDFGRSPRT